MEKVLHLKHIFGEHFLKNSDFSVQTCFWFGLGYARQLRRPSVETSAIPKSRNKPCCRIHTVTLLSTSSLSRGTFILTLQLLSRRSDPRTANCQESRPPDPGSKKVACQPAGYTHILQITAHGPKCEFIRSFIYTCRIKTGPQRHKELLLELKWKSVVRSSQ